MAKDSFNILIVGVGGQGVLLASEILSEVAMSHGLDVKKSEVHGMAQRGGVVTVDYLKETNTIRITNGRALSVDWRFQPAGQLAGVVMDKFKVADRFQWRQVWMVPGAIMLVCVIALLLFFKGAV